MPAISHAKIIRRTTFASICLATLLGLLINSAPHGELLAAERLFWIGLSLLLYSSLVIFFLAVPAHLAMRRLKLCSLPWYLAAGAGLACCSYVLLYRLVEGSIWLSALPYPLMLNALVGALVGLYFHNGVYKSTAQSTTTG